MSFIGHVDSDCFYVSAERLRFPYLKARPVAVLGNHGACIIAKSYELKASGVPTGMPIWEAKEICPGAIYVKRDFEWYETLSRMILAIIEKISPKFEYYSIDELFFTTQECSDSFAKNLQHKILTKVGIPVSIGISPTKLLSKLATKSSKPFGYRVIKNEEDRLALLKDRPVADITGIAKRRVKKLAEYNIQTCDQFVQADRRLIRRLLTKSGEDIWFELNGDPVLPVQIVRPEHKFVSRGGSIGRASNDPARIKAFVVRNVERLVDALTTYKYCCDHLILSLLFTDSPERSMRSSLLGSRNDFEALLEAALHLLPLVWYPPGSSVHYMHVIAGGIRPIANRQLSLFEQPQLSSIKSEINQAVGRFALRSGGTLELKDVYRDPANAYDICDVAGKTCF